MPAARSRSRRDATCRPWSTRMSSRSAWPTRRWPLPVAAGCRWHPSRNQPERSHDIRRLEGKTLRAFLLAFLRLWGAARAVDDHARVLGDLREQAEEPGLAGALLDHALAAVVRADLPGQHAQIVRGQLVAGQRGAR